MKTSKAPFLTILRAILQQLSLRLDPGYSESLLVILVPASYVYEVHQILTAEKHGFSEADLNLVDFFQHLLSFSKTEGSPVLPGAQVDQALSALLRVGIPGLDAVTPGPASSARYSASGAYMHRPLPLVYLHLWGQGKADRKHSGKHQVSKPYYSWTERKQWSWKSGPGPEGGWRECGTSGAPPTHSTPWPPGFSAGHKAAPLCHHKATCNLSI